MQIKTKINYYSYAYNTHHVYNQLFDMFIFSLKLRFQIFIFGCVPCARKNKLIDCKLQTLYRAQLFQKSLNYLTTYVF